MKQALRELGLSDKAIEVYLAILALGKATVVDISIKTAMKRSTIYDHIEELLKLQAISQSFEGKKRRFFSEHPEKLLEIPARQARALSDAIPDLLKLYRTRQSKPSLRYHEGIEGVRAVHEEILQMDGGEYHYFGSSNSFTSLLGEDYLRDYIKRRIKKNIWSNAIRTSTGENDLTELEGGRRWKRRLKILQTEEEKDMACMTIHAGKVTIISADSESYAMVIESQDLYEMALLMWRIIWNCASDPK